MNGTTTDTNGTHARGRTGRVSRDTRPARGDARFTLDAPWDASALRRFRRVAVRWIYRAAGLDFETEAATPEWLAEQLFAEIVTDPHDDLILALRTGLGVSMVCVNWAPSYPNGAAWLGVMKASGRVLYNLDPGSSASWGWACGELAMRALHDRFVAIMWPSIHRAHALEGTNALNKVMHETAHAIGAELEREWRDSMREKHFKAA